MLPAKNTLGERAFSVTGPTTWNSLPYHIRKISDTNTFQRHQKFDCLIIIFLYRGLANRIWFYVVRYILRYVCNTLLDS